LQVGALHAGLDRHVEERAVSAGDDVRLDFVLGKGMRLEGRVLQQGGAPVAGLRVYAVSGWMPGPVVSQGVLGNGVRRLAAKDSPYSDGTATTDGTGRFVLQGLRPGKYGLFSKDPRWLIRQKRFHQAGEEPFDLLAVPAWSIVGTVRDAVTGEPLPRASLQISLACEGGSSRMLGAAAKDGRLDLWWSPTEEESSAPVRAVIRAAATKHRKAEAKVLFQPGQRSKEVHLALEPLDLEGMALRVVDAGGAGVAFDLVADLVGRFDMKKRFGPVRLVRKAPGSFILRAPAGKWFCRIHSSAPHGVLVSWEGELASATPNKPSAWAVLDGFGTVVLRRSERLAGVGSFAVRIDAADGSRTGVYSYDGAGKEVVLRGFPVGDWKFVLFQHGERVEAREAVHSGVATVVAFE